MTKIRTVELKRRQVHEKNKKNPNDNYTFLEEIKSQHCMGVCDEDPCAKASNISTAASLTLS